MEPRELWERHTVLARAFCQSDEEVRTAQVTLDDAQASRARSLAAFAVVVGNDKAVAEMLGLPEREVRIARRTVGRDDARALADDLLMAPLQHQQPGPGSGTDENARANDAAHAHTQAPAQAADHIPGPDQTQSQPQYQVQGQQQAPQAQQMPSQPHVQYQAQHQQVQHHAAQSYYQPQEHYQQPQEHFQTYDHSQLPDHMGWSPVQDAVLVDGWQSGVDLEILALELGTDLRRLTARAQYLSAQGRLFVAPEETGRQGGKHRRETVQHHTGIPTQQMSSPGDMLLPDGLVPDGYGGYWANWNEMLPAPQA
ncbi:hypothetical protein G4Z16_13635 [Streptomyces bathyalis]|uniref:Uncharacterized protein n=1 Tax=Streptomyces bathyalis TaxID=2710756 RepID=A0A7T1T6G8_9ACTN|nr:hypothetical protein [Streptomyces bathyalis]QPP07252.1 hypothetical protein G4Z16_13635 [Streptomyces bathyalis]